MNNIVIVGAGGFAKEVAFLIDEINREKKEWNLLGFIEKDVGEINGKYKIVNSDSWLEKIKNEIYVVFGLGDSSMVKKLVTKFRVNPNIKYPTLIHPNVIGDWNRIIIGEGNIICAGTIFTTDIRIGSFNTFNLDCTIGHDVVINDFNTINPSVNISGGVKLSEETMLGTGSQILQYKSITNKVIVGAGSVVTKDIIDSGVYVGSPAKKIK